MEINNVSNNYKQNIIFCQAFSEKGKEQLLSKSYPYWFPWGQIVPAFFN